MVSYHELITIVGAMVIGGLPLVGFISKLWIDHLFKVKRAELEQAIAIAARQVDVRFAKLHEQRADLIREVYLKLLEIKRATDSLINAAMFPSEVPDQRFVKCWKLGFEAFGLLDDNRIYFSDHTCKTIEAALALIDQGYRWRVGLGDPLSSNDPQMREELFKRIKKAQELQTNEIPIAVEEVCNVFRRLLGVTDEVEPFMKA